VAPLHWARNFSPGVALGVNEVPDIVTCEDPVCNMSTEYPTGNKAESVIVTVPPADISISLPESIGKIV
jgi:hypothetical protein